MLLSPKATMPAPRTQPAIVLIRSSIEDLPRGNVPVAFARRSSDGNRPTQEAHYGFRRPAAGFAHCVLSRRCVIGPEDWISSMHSFPEPAVALVAEMTRA